MVIREKGRVNSSLWYARHLREAARMGRAHLLLAIVVGTVVTLGVALTPGNPADLFYLKLYSVTGQIWLFPALLFIANVALAVVARRFDRPSRVVGRFLVKERWHLATGLSLTLLAIPFIQSFSVLKSSIPAFTRFWADPLFAEADRLLFLGTDPWRITHSLIGPNGTRFLDLAYITWFPVMFATMAWLNFSRNRRFQVRGLLTFYLSWFLLGFVMALSLASVGPCFYADYYGSDRFAPLMAEIEAQPLAAVRSMAFLRSASNGEFGSGISAMPSLHVGMAVLTAILCRDGLRWRWPTYAALAYALTIFVASVHLGWHYALDGLVAAVGVCGIWKATGAVINKQRESASDVSLARAPRLASSG